MQRALIIIEAYGKKKAWSSILGAMGIEARIVATGGHFVMFPKGLFPLGIDLTAPQADPERRADPEKTREILTALAHHRAGNPIWIATDADSEGDVIALDLVETILGHDRTRIDDLLRVRASAMNPQGIAAAHRDAIKISQDPDAILRAAVYGRARAITDRWIGGVFSRQAGAPVGRVRSAILGGVFLRQRAPHLLSARPETGEITFQARSETGGRPFIARIPLYGDEDPQVLALYRGMAHKWTRKLVPGAVRPPASLGAASVPRTGSVAPFNTADALIHAARHHGLTARVAMQGLQDAYMAGQISYPRTQARAMSVESAVHTTRIGHACGLKNLDEKRLTRGHDPDQGHEALHPVGHYGPATGMNYRDLLRQPLPRAGAHIDRELAQEIMATLVTRRCFEAASGFSLENGNWHPDNSGRLSDEEIRALDDLEWVRERNFRLPWSKNLMTGIRQWPDEAVILEMMSAEGLGRPATLAEHVTTALASGDIMPGTFPEPPRPSPQGIKTLKRMPRALWSPATCRFLERCLEGRHASTDEDDSETLHGQIRQRIQSWLQPAPDVIRVPLLEALAGTDTGAVTMNIDLDDDPDLSAMEDSAPPAPCPA